MLESAKVMAVIPVHDLSKARTFWEKMVGLAPSEVDETGESVVYYLNDTGMLVYRTDVDLGGATKSTLMVDDLSKEMDDLRNHGVKFEDFDMPGMKTVNGVLEGPQGRAAWFKDLEGNYVALMEGPKH